MYKKGKFLGRFRFRFQRLGFYYSGRSYQGNCYDKEIELSVGPGKSFDSKGF